VVVLGFDVEGLTLVVDVAVEIEAVILDFAESEILWGDVFFEKLLKAPEVEAVVFNGFGRVIFADFAIFEEFLDVLEDFHEAEISLTEFSLS